MEKNQHASHTPIYPVTFGHYESKPINPEEQVHEENVAELAKKFEQGDTLYTLKELSEQAQGIADEWENDGFGYGYSDHAAIFLDESGRLVMLARHNESSDLRDNDSPQTWRVLFDDTVVTLTIPDEFKDESLHLRDGTGSDDVYTVPWTGDTTPPEDLQRLIDKFGPHLGIAYELFGSKENRDIPQYSLESEIGEFCELSEVVSRAKKDNELAIEKRAQAAKAAVRRGLFMTAKKHAKLQEEAYRSSIQQSTSR